MKPTTNPYERPVYDGAELHPFEGHPGAMDALKLPSRIGRHLVYRSGERYEAEPKQLPKS